eukprot:5719191-Heterocapsa_arctica.AAC.1
MGQKHLKREKATAAGVSYDDWYGNNEADVRAKKGAEQHGYTASQKFAVLEKVDLTRIVQEHMIKNYLKYITHPLVRKDALENKKVKDTPTGVKGRQIITPEQMGHDVKIC